MATNSKEKSFFKKLSMHKKIQKHQKKSINLFEKIKRLFKNPLALTMAIVLVVLITTIIILLVQRIDGQNNGQQSNSSSSQSSNNKNNEVSSTEQSNQDRSEDTHSDENNGQQSNSSSSQSSNNKNNEVSSTEQSNQDRSEDTHSDENNGQQSNSSSSQSSNNDQKPDNNTEDANGNAVSNNANNDTPSNDTCERRTAHYPCVPEFYETAPALVFNQSFYDEMHSKTTDDMNNYFLAHYRELLEPALSFNKRLENVIYNADYKNKIQYYIDNYQEEADSYMRHLLSTYYGSGNAQTLNYGGMSYTERKKAQFDKFLYWDWSTKRRHVTCDKMIRYLRDYESTVGGSWDCSEHFTDLIIIPSTPAN